VEYKIREKRKKGETKTEETRYRLVFLFIGQFSDFLNLKNMIWTHKKDFCEKKNPNIRHISNIYIYIYNFNRLIARTGSSKVAKI